jgi:uncharacterized membrane protein YedE/YeeE
MMMNIWLGIFSGIAFGFIVQRVGATNPNKMARAHLMLEPEIPQFMILTIALSALGLLGLQATGEPRTVILPTSIIATGIAAVIFGIGWGLTGYCPGTCWAAAGEGRMDAVFTLIGGLAGTAVFAQFHETLIPILYLPSSVGPISLAELFGSKTVGAWILALVFLLCVWSIGKLWGRRGFEL